MREYQIGVNSFYTEYSYLSIVIDIFIFSMHDFDLIFILKIRWEVWVSIIRAVCSTASLHIYEARKIRKMFEVERIEPCAPWYYSRDIQSWHKNPQPSPMEGIEPGSSCSEIYRHLTFQINKILHRVLVASHDRSIEDFNWKMIIGKMRLLTSILPKPSNLFGYSWSMKIELLNNSKSRRFLIGKYNFLPYHERWSELSEIRSQNTVQCELIQSTSEGNCCSSI